MAATTGSSDLTEVLARLASTKLKYGLLLDLCLTGYWDGTLSDEEVTEVHELAKGLNVDKPQVDACLSLAEILVQGHDPGEALKKLGDLGVPQEALAMACGIEEGRLA